MGYIRRFLVHWVLGCGGFLVLSCASAAAPGMAIIVGARAPQLALNQNVLRDIFLKKIFVDGEGQRLIPVNLPLESPLRTTFTAALIGMPREPLDSYWSRQYFQGVSPPYVLASQQAVVRFVATTPGAIGYVAACHVDASVHVVMWIALPINSSKAPDACAQLPKN